MSVAYGSCVCFVCALSHDDLVACRQDASKALRHFVDKRRGAAAKHDRGRRRIHEGFDKAVRFLMRKFKSQHETTNTISALSLLTFTVAVAWSDMG